MLWNKIASLETNKRAFSLHNRPLHLHDFSIKAHLSSIYYLCFFRLPEDQMLKEGYPAYTTSCAWLGYSDQQLKQVSVL